MSALAGLKLVAAKRSTSVAPVVQRRTKLLKKLGEQIELAKAQKEGRQYSATRMRNGVSCACRTVCVRAASGARGVDTL